MKVRAKTLWRVPVFCTAASWLTYYIHVYLGGFFFTVRIQGADGAVALSADPVRSAVFTGVLFLAALLAGGLWAFRTMRRAEIACSAALLSTVYLVIILLQLFLPDFPLTLSLRLAVFQHWSVSLPSVVGKWLGGISPLSWVLSVLTPFLFVPFGRRRTAGDAASAAPAEIDVP